MLVKEGGGDCGGLFSGVKFRLLGFEFPALEQQYKLDIEMRGGRAATRFNKVDCTHLIICSETIPYDNKFCIKAREDGMIVINEHWVEDSISHSALADPRRILYWPVRDLHGIPGCLELHICASGYSRDRCIEIRRMVDFMGASFYLEWANKGTHLICYNFEGQSYELAKKFKADVVNQKWLEDCLKEWTLVPVDNYTISDSKLELKEFHDKCADEEVHKKPAGMDREYSVPILSPCIGRQCYTPQCKISSTDTNRKSFSAGTKRSKDQVEHSSIVKCRRALDYNCNRTQMTMHRYAKNRLTEDIQIPYCQNAQKMAKEGIKLILLRAYELIIDLHHEDKSLKGSFSSNNFLIHLHSKKITLQDVEVLNYSKGDREADKAQFVMMTKDLFGKEIPTGIIGWLHCIEKGAPNNVLRRHVNMIHSSIAFGEFWMMFHILQKVKAFTKDKYNILLSSLKKYSGWKSRRFSWCILRDNFSYRNPNANDKSESYEDNFFGLVELFRNCWAHRAKLYSEYFMAVVLMEYPEFLSDLQQTLYDVGCLPHLDIKYLH